MPTENDGIEEDWPAFIDAVVAAEELWIRKWTRSTKQWKALQTGMSALFLVLAGVIGVSALGATTAAMRTVGGAMTLLSIVMAALAWNDPVLRNGGAEGQRFRDEAERRLRTAKSWQGLELTRWRQVFELKQQGFLLPWEL